MKPGATTSCVASMVRSAARLPSRPGAWSEVIQPSVTQRSARNQGAPVPSTTLPPVMRRSQGRSAAVGGNGQSEDEE